MDNSHGSEGVKAGRQEANVVRFEACGSMIHLGAHENSLTSDLCLIDCLELKKEDETAHIH